MIWASTSERVERYLGLWRGTPFAIGGKTCGLGADCGGFVLAALNVLQGGVHGAPKIRPTALRRASLLAILGKLAVSFGSARIVDEGCVLPGDIVFDRFDAIERHVAIVGGRRGNVWECVSGAGVRSDALHRLSAAFFVVRVGE